MSRIYTLVALLVLVGLVIAGCAAPAQPKPTPTAAPAQPTQAPTAPPAQPTQAPTAPPAQPT
ncbi:MAG: hypothetical protein ACUVWW_08725, partial [Anaerolineae bacterium]